MNKTLICLSAIKTTNQPTKQKKKQAEINFSKAYEQKPVERWKRNMVFSLKREQLTYGPANLV